MNDKLKTQGSKFACVECKNEIPCDLSLQVDDVIECPFCGMEYEIVEKDGNEFVVQVIEEEK